MLLKNIKILTLEQATTAAEKGLYFKIQDGKVKALTNK